ncbi:MAG: nitroreductase family protein [Burkholderiales bacterium]|nr:nitroreductase family protein [Burkholderiales bacterium]
MLLKPAVTDFPIHELLAHRWSPRAFDVAKPVSREQVLALVEAARWAPSCFGEEPWRVIVWDRARDTARWQKAFDCLAEGNQAWVKNTPLLIAVGADPQFGHNGKDNRWAQYDSGAAGISLCLQAVALGLAAHQMGGFDAQKLRDAFGIPAHITLMSMIAVGYQAAPDVLTGEVREREVAPRRRRPLGEIFFEGGWGVPIK